jgi:hypothetical protein
LNTGNFKGPVAFFTPYFWSRASVEDPRLSGMFLDTRPSAPNRSFSMETQHIPCTMATDTNGQTYVRMAHTMYPVGADGQSVVMHRITSYSKRALWDGVKAWFEGGAPVDGAIDPKGAYLRKFNGQGGAGWQVFASNIPKEEQTPFATDAFMHPVVSDSTTFGFRWEDKWMTKTKTKEGTLVTLPEYYRLAKDDKDSKGKWVPVAPGDVPTETGLAKLSFGRAAEKPFPPLVTPEAPESCWKKPGPAAGPFTAKLGDGSTVIYYWYRFANQPALLNADLTDAEREELQKRVEKIHRYWTKGREYLAPPTVGKLAELDPALIVKPPPGLEVGYVPIVTRQAMGTK